MPKMTRKYSTRRNRMAALSKKREHQKRKREEGRFGCEYAIYFARTPHYRRYWRAFSMGTNPKTFDVFINGGAWPMMRNKDGLFAPVPSRRIVRNAHKHALGTCDESGWKPFWNINENNEVVFDSPVIGWNHITIIMDASNGTENWVGAFDGTGKKLRVYYS